ncbi:MAG: hypothetical protein M5U26_27500 [Planctomycetota bacterium]|nr:hypothetical protein [Planctomycetota bacterium]
MLALAFAIVCQPAPRPSQADGFHTEHFSEPHFPEQWEKLRFRLFGAAQAGDAVDASLLYSVIQELLDILHYVDPYNIAPDSPPWAQTEAGREMARAMAQAILCELAADSAQPVWEAYAQELRFESPAPRKLLEEIRTRRATAEATWLTLREKAGRRIPRLLGSLETDREREDREIAAAVRLYLTTRDPLIVQRLGPETNFRLDSHLHRPYRGESAAPPSRLNSPEALIRELKRFDDLYRVDDLYLLASSYRAELDKAESVARSFRSRYPEFVRGDVLPCPEYAEALEEVLLRMGARAEPLLREGLNHRSPRVAQAARRLLERLRAGGVEPYPGLRALESRPLRLARLAAAAWDYGDPHGPSPATEEAARELRRRGSACVPDLRRLEEIEFLGLGADCRRARRFLTGQ